MGATRLTFPEGGLRLSAISLQRFLCIELCFCYCAQYSLRRNSVGKKREAGLLCLRLRWRVLKLSPYFFHVCVGKASPSTFALESTLDGLAEELCVVAGLLSPKVWKIDLSLYLPAFSA